jgi:hypothetical protein
LSSPFAHFLLITFLCSFLSYFSFSSTSHFYFLFSLLYFDFLGWGRYFFFLGFFFRFRFRFFSGLRGQLRRALEKRLERVQHLRASERQSARAMRAAIMSRDRQTERAAAAPAHGSSVDAGHSNLSSSPGSDASYSRMGGTPQRSTRKAPPPPVIEFGREEAEQLLQQASIQVCRPFGAQPGIEKTRPSMHWPVACSYV